MEVKRPIHYCIRMIADLFYYILTSLVTNAYVYAIKAPKRNLNDSEIDYDSVLSNYYYEVYIKLHTF